MFNFPRRVVTCSPFWLASFNESRQALNSTCLPVDYPDTTGRSTCSRAPFLSRSLCIVPRLITNMFDTLDAFPLRYTLKISKEITAFDVDRVRQAKIDRRDEKRERQKSRNFAQSASVTSNGIQARPVNTNHARKFNEATTLIGWSKCNDLSLTLLLFFAGIHTARNALVACPIIQMFFVLNYTKTFTAATNSIRASVANATNVRVYVRSTSNPTKAD